MNTNELKTCDGKELLEMKFPDREDCVKDFIPHGIGLFGGRPYSGKLRILLDICASIARGAPLWGMETTRGDVLYISCGKTLRDMQRLIFTGLPFRTYTFTATKVVEVNSDSLFAVMVTEEPFFV